MGVKDVEKRLQVLEDIEEIKNLKSMYCYWADEAIRTGDPDKISPLVERFADDGSCDFGIVDVARGKEAVSEFFKLVPVLASYAAHLVCNPIIRVDGDRATGSWYVHCPLTIRATNEAVWLQGRYEEEYVKKDGEWMWYSMKTIIDFVTPFDEGWAKTPMIDFDLG